MLGCLLLLLCFGTATETSISVREAGRSYACADVIDPGDLVSGTPAGPPSAAAVRTPAERRLGVRLSEACAPLEQRAQLLTWSGLALGGLLVMAGWTALRDEEGSEPVRELQPSH